MFRFLSKPQLFINEVLNCVDDSIFSSMKFSIPMFRFLLKPQLFTTQASMFFCIFLIQCSDTLTGEELLDLNTLGDSRLDAQLDGLRNRLTLVGQEADVLKREITTWEKHFELVNDSAASLDELLQLYENSMNEAFQDASKQRIFVLQFGFGEA